MSERSKAKERREEEQSGLKSCSLSCRSHALLVPRPKQLGNSDDSSESILGSLSVRQY